MHFTGEITLGSIGIIVTLISLAMTIGAKLGDVQAVVKNHGADLLRHAARLDRYESQLVENISQVQRLIGRVESTQTRMDNTTHGRRTESHQP